MISEGSAAGLEVWIEGKNDQKRLNEYQVKHHPTEGNHRSYTECFLETIDEPFHVVFGKTDHNRDQFDYCIGPKFDGTPSQEKILLRGCQLLTISYILEEENGKTYKSSLKFSPLPTTDDSSEVTIDSDTMKNIGTIEILVTRGVASPGRMEGSARFKPKTGIIHEKSKKFAYSVSTTDRTDYIPQKTRHYKFTPEAGKQSSHRFIFRYRPRAILVKMGIIHEPEPEHPLTPPPANRKRKREETTLEGTLDDDDIEEVDVKPLNSKRMKYLEDQVKMLTSRLKRSSNGDKGKDDVVDLTLDDDDD